MLASRRYTVPAILAACIFLIGLSVAATGPYRGVVAIDNLGISNQTYALTLTAGSIATAIASLVLGFFADRVRDRRILVLVCAMFGALAYGLIYLVPTQFTYILAICAILPFGGAVFSQCFSYARVYFNLRRPERAEFMVSMLRTVFTISWVVMPPVAGWIASSSSVFNVFAAAALSQIICTALFALLLSSSAARVGTKEAQEAGDAPQGFRVPRDRVVGIVGIVLVRAAMSATVSTMPLALLNDFGGSLTDVGINASIAAGLEVPCMLAWGIAASRVSKETILLINAVIYVIYMMLLQTADSVVDVFWLQSVNSIATAALLSITISYMQETIKGRVGLSTSLIDVTTVISQMISSLTFAVFALEGSYGGVFAAAAGISIAGVCTLAISRYLMHGRMLRERGIGDRD